SGREAEAAGRLLTMIEKGASPPEAVVQLVKDAAHFDVDESQVARDLQQAFRDDPTLQARIQNPQTEADKELSQQIKDAASSVGSWDYKDYIQPLIDNGRLSIDKQVALDSGDPQQALKDLAEASSEDKEKLVQDPAYKESVLEQFSEDDRKVAKNV